MNRWLRCGLLSMLALVILGVGLAGGVLLDRAVLATFVPTKGIPANAQAEFQLMAEAWNAIQKSYVDRPAVQARSLTYGSISGMVDSLGDTGHSRFLSPEMLKEQRSFTQGEFEGIGAYVEMRDGHVVIVSPMDSSPAQKAGLRAGDIILKVNNEDLSGLTLDQVVAKIMGPAGTSVTLTIQDPVSGESREMTLTRARIALDNVTWERLPGTQVAHVRIVAFSQGVTDNLKVALSEIQQQGLTGAVLDLRNNPGGLLDEAIGVASQFLKTGNVLLVKNAQGETTPVPVKEGGLATDLSVAVLINQGTASAAEIVSGALQDAQRARLVGETTFGTGTVLNEVGLSDGSALLLATQEWLTPSGRVIWHQGIAPDVQVALPEGSSLLIPEEEKGMTADQLQANGDAQLLRALELLSGTAVQPGPTAGPSASPGGASARSVTLDNDGQAIALQAGERFLLNLGEQYEWAASIDDSSVVSRVMNVTVIRGAQGLYEAKQVGTTLLRATGDPACRKSEPACGMPSRLFEIKVVVH
jgi:carboxyl-terminal processing protease